VSAGERVALVTGAGRGIGAATVAALTTAGWRVLAVDIAGPVDQLAYPTSTADDLEEVVAAAPEGTAAAYVADVRDPEALAGAVAAAEQRWGGLDAAIACAGAIAGGIDQWQLPLAAEQALLDINLSGVLNLARVAVPALLRRPQPRSGRFIAVASGAATKGLEKLVAYSAAKAGVTGAVRSLAAELGASGVTANAVSPGSTDTTMLAESARLYDLTDVQVFAAQQPIGRLIAPEEVAAVTGAVIPVDGGFAL
jgi:SDR family mycofactocin-dependent oxidoreductase